MNIPQVFNFDNQSVRIIEKNGEPWFVVADVCAVLGIVNNRNASSRLDDDEKDVHQMDTPSGRQNMTVVNESGLYSLILRSEKPESKRFKKWITSEVLPTIRKTGGYSTVPQIPQTLPEALRLAADLAEKNALLAPKAAIADRIASADGLICIRDAAKALKLPQGKLVTWLLLNKWIYRDQKGKLRGYAEKTPRYITHKVTPIPTDGDEERVSIQAMITAEGLTKLVEKLNVELEDAA